MPSIHIIEDDSDLLALMKYQLAGRGYQIYDDFNGNFLASGGDSGSDLYLVDVNLDNRSGLDLCGMVKSKWQKPVILVSANEHLESMARICGADAWVHKPFLVDSLLGQIARFLLIPGIFSKGA
jgi:DNA-binding response OmpR family regulator